MMDVMLSVNLLTFFSNPVLYIGMAIVGLAMGSFLNVVVHRLPLIIEDEAKSRRCSLSISFPASHCPRCKHRLKAWQNIPLISWLILAGKCHFCQNSISIKYPLIEFICAVIFYGASFLFPTPTALVSALLLFWFLLALSLLDLETFLLPDKLTLPLLWLGLLIHSVSGTISLQAALYGAVLGYLSLWALFWGVKIICGKEGMGYGDFKLLAALGAWVGWQMLPYLCIIAALTGIVCFCARSALGVHSNQIPFGPCLSLAGAIIYISQESEQVWLMFNSV